MATADVLAGTRVVNPAGIRAVNHWIGGRPVESSSGRSGVVWDPATGEPQAHVAFASTAEVDAAVADAKRAFTDWRATPLSRRSEILFRMRELVAENRRRIAEMITSEHGKTVPDAIGEVSRGDDNSSPLVGSSSGIYSDSMVKALRKAADDEKIEAIIIRVDSPGGSAVASDTIWREVVKVKEKGKPVIVSMGDVAASGGYYIAMAADRIFAQPATITGSIGVFTGKPVIGEALKKLDINYERITAGESAGAFSVVTDFSPTDLENINRNLDETYREFTTKAAQGRGKTVEEIQKVARGRVWTGQDAIQAGLVDELGGFSKAVDYAKTKIGLKATDSVVLVPFPEPDQPWWALFKAFDTGDVPANISASMNKLMWLEKVLSPVLREIDGRGQGVQAYMTPIVAN